jgi:hypothetical protein
MPGLPYIFGKQQPYSEVCKMQVITVQNFLDEFKLPVDQKKKVIKSHLENFIKQRNERVDKPVVMREYPCDYVCAEFIHR